MILQKWEQIPNSIKNDETYKYYQQHEQKEFANKQEKKVHNLGQKELSTTTNQIQKPFP